jgi:ABC-type branched-subunit amino acid transport system permease subunit
VNVLADVAFWMLVSAFAGVFAIFTLGLQIQAGTSGLTNFGHVAFLAIGGYTMALLQLRLGVPILLAIVAAILVSVLAALVIAMPTLRLRGGYFAIATIAFGEIVRAFILNEQDLTGGPRGLIEFNRPWLAASQQMLDLRTRAHRWCWLPG